MTTLENSFLRVQINHDGAELNSIFNLHNETEYLWQGDPEFWGRRAPVLFPIVGRLKDDTFSYYGSFYTMKQHGLARNMRFQLVHHRENSARFMLLSKAKTLKSYPFHFALQIEYVLIKNYLTTVYRVINPYTKILHYSIGGHPAFNCPLVEGEERSDYQLVFNRSETASTQLIEEGIRTGERVPILNNENAIQLTNDLFDNDALIFDHLKSNKVSLQKGDTKILTFDFTGFPYLGIWSKNSQSPFVCIEPWHGIADKVSHDQDFSEKEGVRTLAPTEVFECKFTIEIH